MTTADGSFGISGFVTDALKTLGLYVFLRLRTYRHVQSDRKNRQDIRQYSFEERMGCGFGACMGCSCQTKYGSKRICKDGPV